MFLKKLKIVSNIIFDFQKENFLKKLKTNSKKNYKTVRIWKIIIRKHKKKISYLFKS